MRTLIPAALLMSLMSLGCQTAPPAPTPPTAKIQPTVFHEFGGERTDDYYWLNQREDQEVLDYLNAENEYCDAVMAHTKDLQETLFEEITGRIKQDDNTVPYLDRGWWRYQRYEEGLEYPIICRKEGSLDASEQILLNVNTLAEGHGYFQVRGAETNSTGEVLAWAQDDVGRRLYTIKFKTLATDAMFDDTIEAASGNMVWAEDGKTLFYTKKDLQTLRTYQVYRHVLGTPAADDALVYQEDDDTFGVSVGKTTSHRFITIGCDQTLATEHRYVDAYAPDGEFQVFLPRERDHEYDIDHLGDSWFVKTNRKARNFKLMRTPTGATSEESWTDVIPHRDDVLFQRAVLFDDWLAVLERCEGLRRLRVIEWATGEEHTIEVGESVYAIWPATNREHATDVLRFGYESMTTPESTFDYDMRTRTATLLKETEVLGGFDRNDYATERLMVTARDGVQVPVSLVYRKGYEINGASPLLLYGYGSYGSSTEPYFSSARLSLLDRGFAYAIAHIRGGQEMGRWWYEDGKLMKKMNTFTDFIDCGQALVDRKYADPERLYAMGGSAGGLLVGAVVNLAPDLFDGVVAQVPFVDVVTTMLDESIPLTTGEYDEWGNPNEEEAYRYMLSYSPYDNVTAQAYPHLLITTGLHDSQVQYFEPAKWTAKLRAMKTDQNRLLMKTNMEAGHGGASGRYRRYRETALDYAFLLDLAGIEN